MAFVPFKKGGKPAPGDKGAPKGPPFAKGGKPMPKKAKSGRKC